MNILLIGVLRSKCCHGTLQSSSHFVMNFFEFVFCIQHTQLQVTGLVANDSFILTADRVVKPVITAGYHTC